MSKINAINVENRIDSEIAAAITMALACYNAEEHDEESFVLTLHQQNTGWNSHQRTIRHLPKKK